MLKELIIIKNCYAKIIESKIMTKLTAKEYLNNDIESVIDHLNNSSVQSEMPFVQAVLTARATISSEKQTRQMVFLTGAMVVATLLLVIVPVIVRYLENDQLKDIINNQANRIESLEQEVKKIELNNILSLENFNNINQLKMNHKSFANRIAEMDKNISTNKTIIDDYIKSAHKHNNAN
jgi:hypothetical protein